MNSQKAGRYGMKGGGFSPGTNAQQAAEPVGIFGAEEASKSPNLLQNATWLLWKCLTVPPVFLFTGKPLKMFEKNPGLAPPILWPFLAFAALFVGLPTFVCVYLPITGIQCLYDNRSSIGKVLFGARP